ncbi:hypothetical protein [Hoyosella subflava]|uniref:Putative integral membrane protein n=1 Tax=Hoyosella subflava (strain DSM 45089 / JCM 17490 / NBRC 109087 / DQS3-9A1) TaxID=443218 RepID=F6ESI2_HOYSD|nr:hypothetical protein [Hoyosella subflava]AEF43103.1 Putative integral membrane protein [Hoyosella subflava DQS3-9A1]
MIVLAAAELPDSVVGDINLLLGWAAGLVGAAAVAKVIFVGGRWAWDRRHNPGVETPTTAELLAALAGWIIAASAALPIATLLLTSAYGPQASAPAGKCQETATREHRQCLVNQISDEYGGEPGSGGVGGGEGGR